MSYDLMVFDTAEAPKERAAFLTWLEGQPQGDDPAVASPPLRACFADLIQTFPPMNGPLAVEELPEDDRLVTDYAIAPKLIHMAFAWSKAEMAYGAVFERAGKHGVGFFDMSSEEGEVWLPDGRGGLTLAHSEEQK